MAGAPALTRRELLAAGAGAAVALALPGIARTPTADAAPLGKAALRELRAAVRGRVLSPGSTAYDRARLLYNTRFDGIRPPAVVEVADVADVQAVVGWANRRDVALVARSGGNAYNGASTSRTAVVVDFGALNGISVSGATATVGVGARNVEVYTGLAKRGAALPSGSCPNVALGGLMTGGGMGLSGRMWGLTLDQVRAFDVVKMDGTHVRVDARSDEDLFWALRGGGGSFALVCGAELAVRKAPTGAWCFCSWPAARRADVLGAWDGIAPGASDEATLICTLTPTGVTLIGQHLGGVGALRSLIRPLLAIDGARASTGTSGWLALQQRWAACAQDSVAACRILPRTTFAASSVYVAKKLPPAGRRAFAAAADAGATLVCDAYGGAVNAVAPDATAFVHRDARFSVQIVSFTSVATAKARVKRARGLIAPYSDGQAYQNYADPDLAGPLTAYYGANLPRLRAIKAAVDPDWRLRPTQGVPPPA